MAIKDSELQQLESSLKEENYYACYLVRKLIKEIQRLKNLGSQHFFNQVETHIRLNELERENIILKEKLSHIEKIARER